jgi:L-rhamnose mutarotase
MQQVMVRYKVKPERVEENERLVRAVYEELKDADPERFHYATFRLDDGVTFVHLAITDTEDGRSPLSDLEAFQRFQEEIEDRCEESPVVSELSAVGSFRLIGSGS